VRLRINDSKRDAQKAPLDGLAAPEHVNLDHSVSKIIAVEPYHAHAGAFADL
jgi:hypothetical protein